MLKLRNVSVFSAQNKEALIDDYQPSSETRVISNGIDYTFYASPDIQPIPEFNDGHPNILFVGRMDERKGFRYPLRVYLHIRQRFPEARLLAVRAYQPEEVAIFTDQIAWRARVQEYGCRKSIG